MGQASSPAAAPAAAAGGVPAAAVLLILTTGPAGAAEADLLPSLAWIDPRTAVGLAVLTGLVIFATTLAILHVLERAAWTRRETALLARIDGLQAAADRAEWLVGTERQAVVSWSGPDGAVAVDGDASVAGAEAAAEPARVTAFADWLQPGDAARLHAALDRLRTRGEGFRAVLRTGAAGYVEAEGRAVGGRALLRLRDVSAFQSGMMRAEAETAEARDALGRLTTLLDAVAEPVWLKTETGRLLFANAAYCAAVDAASQADARERSLELMGAGERDEAARLCRDGGIYRARVVAIVAGGRRVLDITEAPVGAGRGGIAQDVSELEGVRSDLGRQMRAHVRVLDQLPTAVAMFDAAQRLVFHNAAFRQLWALDAAALEGHPQDGEILDRLRAERRLPEQADFRAWKAEHLGAYGAAEPKTSWWHLPDRRTVRVIANPAPGGGLTYLFDDVSDSLALESRFNSLIRVQRETLDTLREGVVLFGSDGRLKLFNRAFAESWRLSREALTQNPHIDAVVGMCRTLSPDDDAWGELSAVVSGLPEMRLRASARMERQDGMILESAAEPLPDGSTLLTFVDVTASVNVERALVERTDALELAGAIRNKFVGHVSYELRSPLNIVIGFAELLGAGTAGTLNERQRDYADGILRSARALLTVIDDTLDLASVETDMIQLARDTVPIRETIEAAAQGLADRLVEARIGLVIEAPAGIGSFTADGQRVRQVLFNLLANAIGFSAPGQTVRVSAARTETEVVLTVADEGRGIPDESRALVFEPFESDARGTAHRGAGLGLSIVRAFVELHGGRVALTSEPGRGTSVACHFPIGGRPGARAAAE